MVDQLPISTVGGVQKGSATASKPASVDTGQGVAFRALLDQLADRAKALEESSTKPMKADDLAGAVDRAHESLQDALALSGQLIEAYRASVKTRNGPNGAGT
jgi:hypothetical protein